MGTAERRSRQRGHGGDRRTCRGHAAVRADECPFGAWHRHVEWDHPASIRNGRSHGPDHRRPGRILGLALASGGARSWSSSRVRSPFTHRSAASARPPRTARGRRSSSDLAKWMTSSTRGRSHTSFTSPSRVCPRATPHELTSRTRARARVSDDLTERDLPCGGGVVLFLICGLLTESPTIRGGVRARSFMHVGSGP